MIDETEFSDVIEVLGRYRPLTPQAAKVAAIASALQPGSRWRWPVAIAAAAVVVAALGFWAWQAKSPMPAGDVDLPPLSGPEYEKFSQTWLKQARHGVPWQTPKKPVVVTVFMDWQCIGCFTLDQNLMQALDRLERAFPGRITVIFEDWPWDPECNASLPQDFPLVHQGSCELARAVRRARERGRAAELIKWLRDHQQTWKGIGLPEGFRVSATEGETAVHASIARGQLVKVKATPTIFINGVRVERIMPAQDLEWAIRLELARGGRRGLPGSVPLAVLLTFDF